MAIVCNSSSLSIWVCSIFLWSLILRDVGVFAWLQTCAEESGTLHASIRSNMPLWQSVAELCRCFTWVSPFNLLIISAYWQWLCEIFKYNIPCYIGYFQPGNPAALLTDTKTLQTFLYTFPIIPTVWSPSPKVSTRCSLSAVFADCFIAIKWVNSHTFYCL